MPVPGETPFRGMGKRVNVESTEGRALRRHPYRLFGSVDVRRGTFRPPRNGVSPERAFPKPQFGNEAKRRI